jgi:hypothetical protein
VQYGDVLSAQALISFDANINGFNSYNETPLDLSLRQSRAMANLLEGIGGMEGVEILGELQVFDSHYNYMGGIRGSDEEDSLGIDGASGGREEGVTGRKELEYESVDSDKISGLPEGLFSRCCSTG